MVDTLEALVLGRVETREALVAMGAVATEAVVGASEAFRELVEVANRTLSAGLPIFASVAVCRAL